MSVFTIRRADKSDIAALCALEAECFSLPWSERGFADFFALDYTAAYAAVADGAVVGYAGMYISFEDGDITNIAVSAPYRRRGIARALIGALSAHAGIKRLFLEVRESNAAARELYLSCGFKIDGVRRGFYQKPAENAVLMSLDVKS